MEPFLKWAGGKRWLISKSSNLIPLKGEVKNYFEPFLGGGAVFFHLQPTKALLSDTNKDLINAYQVIRDHWRELVDLLHEYQEKHSHEYYYLTRETRFKDKIMEAARFIYLNRTCWNGLYRVNKNGKFNVPIGTKTKVISPDDDFEGISNLLQNKQIEHLDFEAAIDRASKGDFIFVDPPYTVKHNLNGFVKYNENIFSWEDQIRLRDCILRAIERGASVLMLNADHESIKEIYNEIGNISSLERASVIAGKSKARGVYSELALKNF